jgi:hypothetical protein
MDDSNFVVESLIDYLSRKQKYLQELLSELSLENYPYDEVIKLINKLRSVLNGIKYRLDELRENIDKDKLENTEGTVRLYSGLLEYIYAFYNFIKLSTKEQYVTTDNLSNRLFN